MSCAHDYLGASTAHPFGNQSLLSRPIPDEAADALTGDIADVHVGHPGGRYLALSPWRTADWRGLGFEAVGRPPLMFRPVQQTPAPLLPDGCRIGRVRTVDDSRTFERLLVHAYPLEEMRPWHAGALLGERVLESGGRMWVGFGNDGPMATAGCVPGPAVTLLALVPLLRYTLWSSHR